MLDPNTVDLLKQLGLDSGNVEALVSGAIVLTLVTIIAAIPTVMIAKRKGRSRMLWLVLALSIPVLPLLLIWLLPKAPGQQS
jgi:RsiW-degrading membrane proteinase PrsW (M82 family)